MSKQEKKKKKSTGGNVFPFRMYPGVSVRQWYKGMIVSALVSKDNATKDPAKISELAGEIADRMIAEDERFMIENNLGDGNV